MSIKVGEMITKDFYLPTLQKTAYFTVLIIVSSFILLLFIRPAERHAGINQYSKSKFLDMVEWRAARPFVSRTLLPTSIKIVSAIVPDRYLKSCAEIIERYKLTRKAFDVFGWETYAAFQYIFGSILMLLCFIGFSHYLVKLTIKLCNIKDNHFVYILLGVAGLMGLPPFFRYNSFLYDPPQLFLFTLSLYLLVNNRFRAFNIVFVLCCFNKETAVLLIPLYGLTFRNKASNSQRYWRKLLELFLVYISIKLTLAWIFHSNPGSFVELQLKRNIQWLAHGWTFTDVTVFLGIILIICFDWKKKPEFLRLSLIYILPPVLFLALFLGWLNEWRIFYEVYPIVFGLGVDSFIRIVRSSNQNIQPSINGFADAMTG
jgi:hypothetical protein